MKPETCRECDFVNHHCGDWNCLMTRKNIKPDELHKDCPLEEEE